MDPVVPAPQSQLDECMVILGMLALLPWFEVRALLADATRGVSGSSLHPVALGFDLHLGALCIIVVLKLLGSCMWVLRSSPERSRARSSGPQVQKPERRGVSGLKWLDTGRKPISGHLLENEELAAALMRKKQFSQQEWHAFGITDLRKCHYVTSGGSYLIPAETCLCGSGQLFDQCHNPTHRYKLRVRNCILAGVREKSVRSDQQSSDSPSSESHQQ